MLRRYPDGIGTDGFFQKEVTEYFPDWLPVAEVRVFLDVNRNAYGQSFIAPYSLRARPGAPVATPLDWSELGRSTPNRLTLSSIRARLARKDDPWSGIDRHASSAASARRSLDALTS